MSYHRFFVHQSLRSSKEPQSIMLDRNTIHHMDVLRVKMGERMVLVDSNGHPFEAEFSSLDTDSVCVRYLRPIENHELPSLTLFQGISKGERMDLVFRSCTELGLVSIVPVFTSRCIVRFESDKAHAKGERWRRIAASASEQAGREVSPAVPDPISFDEAVKQAMGLDMVICPYEEAEDGSIREVMAGLDPKASVGLFIGPEGGFDSEEIDSLVKIGSKVVTLGPTILRTETAGIVASTLVLSELGGLGMSR